MSEKITNLIVFVLKQFGKSYGFLFAALVSGTAVSLTKKLVVKSNNVL